MKIYQIILLVLAFLFIWIFILYCPNIISVSSFDDYEGNHNDIGCHGSPKQTIENENIGIELIVRNIFIILIFSFSIILSLFFIYWIYSQRNINSIKYND